MYNAVCVQILYNTRVIFTLYIIIMYNIILSYAVLYIFMKKNQLMVFRYIVIHEKIYFFFKFVLNVLCSMKYTLNMKS